MEEQNNILSKLQIKQPNVPDEHYFEQLAKQIATEDAKVFPLYKRQVFYWAAAAILLVLFAIPLFYGSHNDHELSSQVAALNESSIEAYMLDNADDFLLEEIAVLANDSILAKVELSLNESMEVINVSESIEALPIDAIEDYLDEESIDYDELDEEFFI